MQITKLDVAKHQLDVSIRLFLEGDYLSSLTLAGAAEEILGKLSERAGKPSAVDYIIKHFFERTGSEPTEAEYKRLLGILNKGRNAAKHANDPDETHFNVEVIYPLQMIMRAIPMAGNLGAVLDNEASMRAWVHSHPEETEE